MKLNQNQMEVVDGGAITSSWVNAISKAIMTLYELGRQSGSAIRRLITGNYC